MDLNKECLSEWKGTRQNAEKEPTKKPKYSRLRLSDKLDILRRVDRGENHAEIARLYNIARTTISWVKKKRDRILWYSQIQGPAGPETLQTKKMMTNVEDTPFEKALFAWFEEKRINGESVTGPVIQEKALHLNKELGGPIEFKASNGWLTRFKKRHGIRQLSLQGVKLGSVDFESAKSFCNEFEQMIQENECTQDNIYNAVKTGLQWNALPQQTVDGSSSKVLKDRVTLIACFNADGSQKLPMMVVGRSKNPRSFKDFDIPVKYVFHGNGYPSDALLEEWFQDLFLPDVRKRQEDNGKSEKLILLIDTVPSFKLLNMAEQNGVKIMTFPPHVTSLIQPLNQGILETFKKHYKQNFFNEMLVQKNEKIVNKSDRRWTMKDCCFSIAAAWNSFTVDDVQFAWRKLLKLNELEDRNNQIIFLSCGISDENKPENEDENLFDEDMMTGDFESHMSCSMEVENSCDSESSVKLTPGVQPEICKNAVLVEEMLQNLMKEAETMPKPTTKDAFNAINVIYKWVMSEKDISQQDIETIYKLRQKIIERICDENLSNSVS